MAVEAACLLALPHCFDNLIRRRILMQLNVLNWNVFLFHLSPGIWEYSWYSMCSTFRGQGLFKLSKYSPSHGNFHLHFQYKILTLLSLGHKVAMSVTCECIDSPQLFKNCGAVELVGKKLNTLNDRNHAWKCKDNNSDETNLMKAFQAD